MGSRGTKKPAVLASKPAVRILGRLSKQALVDLAWDLLCQIEGEGEMRADVDGDVVLTYACPVLTARGDRVPRAPAGKARVDLSGRCPDCQVAPGCHHKVGCDVARCAACGGQRLSCGCGEPADGGPCTQHWTGEWPGDEDCRRLGFLLPDGRPDLNRLPLDAVWDAATGRWDAKRG